MRWEITKLKWSANPVPTVHTAAALQQPFTLKTTCVPCKPPCFVFINLSTLKVFLRCYKKNFNQMSKQEAPTGYQCRKSDENIIYYNLSSS